MKTAAYFGITLIALALGAGSVGAQNVEAEIEASGRYMEEWVAAVSDFVKDVRFDEQDLKSFISNWSELSAMGEDEFGADDEEEEELLDFEEVLSNRAYRSWAKSRGLDPEIWMRKWMRITAMLMSDQIGKNMALGARQIKEQLAELEQQRAQLGEELYRQMKQAMEASVATMNNADAAYRKLPEPSAEEKSLLDRYLPQLMSLE